MPRHFVKITRKSCKYLIVQISRKKMIIWLRWANLSSQTIALFRNDSFIQVVKLAKSRTWHCHWYCHWTWHCHRHWYCHWQCHCHGNILVHAWKIRRKSTNGQRISCSLLISHIQIFQSTDLKTMGIWKWITFFDTHCTDMTYAQYLISISLISIFHVEEYNVWIMTYI